MKVFYFVCILRLISGFCQCLTLLNPANPEKHMHHYHPRQKSALLLLLHREGASAFRSLSSQDWETSSPQAKRFLLEPCAPGPEISGDLFFFLICCYQTFVTGILHIMESFASVLSFGKQSYLIPGIQSFQSLMSLNKDWSLEMKEIVMKAAFVRVLRFQVIEKTLFQFSTPFLSLLKQVSEHCYAYPWLHMYKISLE